MGGLLGVESFETTEQGHQLLGRVAPAECLGLVYMGMEVDDHGWWSLVPTDSTR